MTPRSILQADGELRGAVKVPASKSYTHRAVLTASLSDGESVVRNPLVSRDTTATVQACSAMGASIEEVPEGFRVTGAIPHTPDGVINVENSGTTLRFMTSVFSLADHGYTILTGDSSIRSRPMQPLLDTLTELGAHVKSSRDNGCAPIIVGEGAMHGGKANLRGDVSSQFVSSILISTPLAAGKTFLHVFDAVSRPYIDATLSLTRLHGAEVTREGYSDFEVEGSQTYSPADFTVPGDFSSAAFVMAAVGLLGGRVELTGLTTSLPQADSAMLEIMKKVGAKVTTNESSVTVSADVGALTGGSFDLSDSPDLVPAVSVLGLGSGSAIDISGVSHARFKETDRISVLSEGLARIGAKVVEKRDGLTVARPDRFRRASLDAHGDHRMFMAFALASMLVPGGIPVAGVETLDVSYPSFVSDMKHLGARMETE